MTALAENRLVKTFAELRGAGRKTVAPFLTAGYPDLEATRAMLEDWAGRGVRAVELGIPFSDPIADGPVIQNSYTDALAGGLRTGQIKDMVRGHRRGVERYLDEAAAAGIDAVLIPDLSLEEAGGVERLASGRGLANVMLIAPTTPPPRRLEIARHSRGFIYYVSVAGITGERDKLPPVTIEAVAELKKHTDTPVCVGFGISTAEMVRTVCEAADAAIVGSAIVHRITDRKDLPTDRLVAEIGDFVSELLQPVA